MSNFREGLNALREISDPEKAKLILEKITGKKIADYEGIDALVASLMGYYNDEVKKKLNKGTYVGDAQSLKNEIDGKISKNGDTINGQIVFDLNKIVSDQILIKKGGDTVAGMGYSDGSHGTFLSNVKGSCRIWLYDNGKAEMTAQNLDTKSKDVIGGINEVKGITDSKVFKTGDTMTGDLIFDSREQNRQIILGSRGTIVASNNYGGPIIIMDKAGSNYYGIGASGSKPYTIRYGYANKTTGEWLTLNNEFKHEFDGTLIPSNGIVSGGDILVRNSKVLNEANYINKSATLLLSTNWGSLPQKSWKNMILSDDISKFTFLLFCVSDSNTIFSQYNRTALISTAMFSTSKIPTALTDIAFNGHVGFKYIDNKTIGAYKEEVSDDHVNAVAIYGI